MTRNLRLIILFAVILSVAVLVVRSQLKQSTSHCEPSFCSSHSEVKCSISSEVEETPRGEESQKKCCVITGNPSTLSESPVFEQQKKGKLRRSNE